MLHVDESNAKNLEKTGPEIKLTNVDGNFEYWLELARDRIFSLAAGNRIAKIAPRIMEIGFAKILYAANELGIDVEGSDAYVVFAPDGTCSYNPIRTQRGFSYGGILHFEFDGLLANNNSMPNGCGFSIYELIDPMEDTRLQNYLSDVQVRLGQDKLSQLGKGNHFAGIYYVLDPLSGEDTGRRFVVIHCSGHVGGHKLYHPDSWLAETDGYSIIHTPHGPITLLESEARDLYMDQYKETDDANAHNRDLTMGEIFEYHQDWKKLAAITHQGLTDNGDYHIIGTQVHDSLMPIAFNPEEGLVAATPKPNLSKNFLDRWDQGSRVERFGLEDELMDLNFTPHGSGYEFRYPIQQVEIRLSGEGIEEFYVRLAHEDAKMAFTYFREVREWMAYRRKAPILQKMFEAELAEIVYEMPCLMQIYPLVSIPGGSH